MEVTPLGDSALILHVCDGLGDSPPDTLDRVLGALRQLEKADLPGVLEFAPAYTTIGIFFDPLRVIEAGAPEHAVHEWLANRVRATVSGRSESKGAATSFREIVIPVCYDGDCGPDLEAVSHHTGLATDEVIRRHSAAKYYVHCIGFSPGFPYLGGLPPELAVPRRGTPRKAVPAGSVGIGGAQTGIYPAPSPGGWHLIGRTPIRLFSPTAVEPSVLQAGDRVRFRPITREEFETWSE